MSRNDAITKERSDRIKAYCAATGDSPEDVIGTAVDWFLDGMDRYLTVDEPSGEEGEEEEETSAAEQEPAQQRKTSRTFSPKRHSPEQKKRVLSLTDQGYPKSSIHEITGVPISTIDYWRRSRKDGRLAGDGTYVETDNARTAGGGTRHTDTAKDTAFDLLQRGVSTREASRITGVPKATIFVWLRRWREEGKLT